MHKDWKCEGVQQPRYSPSPSHPRKAASEVHSTTFAVFFCLLTCARVAMEWCQMTISDSLWQRDASGI